jgi:hypothetical protein
LIFLLSGQLFSFQHLLNKRRMIRTEHLNIFEHGYWWAWVYTFWKRLMSQYLKLIQKTNMSSRLWWYTKFTRISKVQIELFLPLFILLWSLNTNSLPYGFSFEPGMLCERTISWANLVYSLSINEIKYTCIKWVHVPWQCFSWKIGIIIIILRGF